MVNLTDALNDRMTFGLWELWSMLIVGTTYGQILILILWLDESWAGLFLSSKLFFNDLILIYLILTKQILTSQGRLNIDWSDSLMLQLFNSSNTRNSRIHDGCYHIFSIILLEF